MVVSLGPTSMATGSNLPKNPKADGTGSNPRCLRRDVNRDAIMGATADRAFSLINDNKEMDGFYNQLMGMPPPKNDPYPWGVSSLYFWVARGYKRLKLTIWNQIHTAGHYVAAVDPGGDANTSPGDPLFYMHHTSLDRLWWIWQMQDAQNRLYALPFVNMTMPMYVKSRQATDPLNTIVDLEWLGPPITLRETHDQLGGNLGAFCYVYV
jgi:tyrosinase